MLVILSCLFQHQLPHLNQLQDQLQNRRLLPHLNRVPCQDPRLLASPVTSAKLKDTRRISVIVEFVEVMVCAHSRASQVEAELCATRSCQFDVARTASSTPPCLLKF